MTGGIDDVTGQRNARVLAELRAGVAARRDEEQHPTPGRWRDAPAHCYEGAVRVLGDRANGIIICRTPRGACVYHTIHIRWRGTTIQSAEVSLHDMADIERRAVALARDIVTRVGWYLGDAEEDGGLDHEEGLV